MFESTWRSVVIPPPPPGNCHVSSLSVQAQVLTSWELSTMITQSVCAARNWYVSRHSPSPVPWRGAGPPRPGPIWTSSSAPWWTWTRCSCRPSACSPGRSTCSWSRPGGARPNLGLPRGAKVWLVWAVLPYLAPGMVWVTSPTVGGWPWEVEFVLTGTTCLKNDTISYLGLSRPRPTIMEASSPVSLPQVIQSREQRQHHETPCCRTTTPPSLQ